MKQIITIILIALATCNQGFLRNLADKGTVKVTSVTYPTACNAYDAGIVFNLAGATTGTNTAISEAKDMTIKLVEKDTPAKTIATKCTITASATPTLECSTTAAATADGNYKPVLGANYTLAGQVGQDTAEILLAFDTITETVKIQSKKYVKPSATQADAAKAINYANTGPYSFTIAFDGDMADTYLPTVKANSKQLTCATDSKDAKKVTCTVTKEDLPEDATDKTKVVSYPVTITNVCGVDETSLITLKISNDAGSTSSQSMLMFSKIALTVLGLLLF